MNKLPSSKSNHSFSSDFAEVFVGWSESDDSLPNSPTGTPRQHCRAESDDSPDVKSSSGSSVTIRKALRRTFSWRKRKNRISSLTNEKLLFTSCRIMLLGFSGVGKTAAVVRFLTGRYIHEYESSQEETYRRTVDMDGRSIALELTSIAQKVRAFDERMLEKNTGVLLVYSVVDLTSFYYIQHLFDSIGRRLTGPVVVVGAKDDLRDKRCVKKSTAQQLAREHNCAYFEVSAALDIGISECFHSVMRKIIANQLEERLCQSINNNNNNNDINNNDKVSKNRTRRSSIF
eukprot:gene5333-6002_t